MHVRRLDAVASRSLAVALILSVRAAAPRARQQRPLVTEDPEPIGAGRVLIEGGLDFAHDQHYPVSGLKGNLWRVPTIGVSVGISSIAELQIDGGLVSTSLSISRAPRRAAVLAGDGDRRHDARRRRHRHRRRRFGCCRRPTAGRRIGFRFATKLPNASNESGLGLDTHRLLRVAARRQDRPVHSVRRQHRRRHSRRSDERKSPERRSDLRRVARTCDDAAGRVRRRAERPRVDPKRRCLSRDGDPRTGEVRRTLHARVRSDSTRASSSA